ncbi:bifunctional 3-(3-hydroxy-phenyl)propionate/3-hydroxycinnamic acid hydroxylase [Pusillimonas sp. TS35]|uniref:bifunctional 3-(3-hydroxy-phenyl)propionate/3-hydroxycinnamic acid hydroxylase n=1 Tax=Paracandidimonas lactea TaxID=2895524 RepID=UPI00136E4245|nr:bifunctional 3-(3-hydroxy-phenyl)propionate/3-hydroxycinnamic acid hydroxylase [Paracandidimonas lactea]MYN14424.1 bifunctional 3-(3-hydroxy-phenyl)propionate/3-hydroxycinnamic acid hydroxylase [Pusillimonas sp. TS35]
MAQKHDVEVIVVGGGPVGVTLANLLGTYGVRTLVLERSASILDYPRAVGLDDEAMRTFQAAGAADEMLKDMIQNVPMRMYSARKKCFAEILPATREFGWFRRNLFSQPLGERTLRKNLARFAEVEMALGAELMDIVQDAHGVDARVRFADGTERTVRAHYLLGADGGRSTVREKLLKIPFHGNTHERKWVVIECNHDPLDAPYTALHCEPARPYVCLKLPYGLRRWEFMLFEGEDGDQMLRPEKVRDLLRNHVAHPETLNVIRARVYTHHSRVAEYFVDGRVAVAGDAAHLTPPWIGQGLNAGLRDAANLAWKTAWIVKGRLKPEVFQTYHDERHAHTKAMIDLADKVGAILSQRNRLLAWVRDCFLHGIQYVPKVRDYVMQFKFKPMPRYSNGVVLNTGTGAANALIGRMFVQPNVECGDGRVVRLDDALGAGFSLLFWGAEAADALDADMRAILRRLDCRAVAAVRARSGDGPGRRPGVPEGVRVVEDAENALHFWFQKAGVDWVLIRPDRYVAAMGAREALQPIMKEFEAGFMAPVPTIGVEMVPAGEAIAARCTAEAA